MTSNFSGPAIILERQAYREHDLLVTLYSQNAGKLTLLARGGKKLSSKLAAHVEPLSLVEVLIIPGRGFDYLASAITKDALADLKNDWFKLKVAGQAINIFKQSVKDNQTDLQLFTFLQTWLSALSQSTNQQGGDFSETQANIFLIHFLLKLIDLLGYRPVLKTCVVCQRKLSAGKQLFDFQLGGLVCQRHLTTDRSQSLVMSENCVKLLRFWQFSNKAIIIPQSLVREATNFLLTFWRYYH